MIIPHPTFNKYSTFNDYYAYGKIAEGQIEQWLIRAHNYMLLPAYEIEYPTNKGPRFLTRGKPLISPDIYAMREVNGIRDRRWIEAKHKSRFSWHWRSKNWQTGIDVKHFYDYVEVQKLSRTRAYILFLHRYSDPTEEDLSNDSPPTCPTGLYCRSLNYLERHWHHKNGFNRAGKNGTRNYPMIYWNHKDLIQLATLEEVSAVCGVDISGVEI